MPIRFLGLKDRPATTGFWKLHFVLDNDIEGEAGGPRPFGSPSPGLANLKRLRVKPVFTFVVLVSSCAWADQVSLKNGDRLTASGSEEQRCAAEGRGFV